jgi:hypothetical protein
MVNGLLFRRRKADPNEPNDLSEPLERAAMASANPDPEDPGAARQLLIRLFEQDDWQITDRARREGFPILRRLGIPFPTDWALVDYVLDLLREAYPMHIIPRGDPPGSRANGYVMNNSDGRGLYIELTIEEARIGQPLAWIMSFHTSKHS